MGRHFPVREKSGNFEQTGKVRENHTKYWKIEGISEKKICYFSMIFKWTVYYLLRCIKFLVRKNKTLKKYWKMEKKILEKSGNFVREFCQPGKVGTLNKIWKYNVSVNFVYSLRIITSCTAWSKCIFIVFMSVSLHWTKWIFSRGDIRGRCCHCNFIHCNTYTFHWWYNCFSLVRHLIYNDAGMFVK